MSLEDKCILIVDDDEDILTAGKLLLKRHCGRVLATADPKQIPQLMAAHNIDAILLDMNFSPGESDGAQGFRWLRTILELDADAVVVMITAHGGINIAVEAIKLGATDFVAKPWQNEKVIATLSAASQLRASRSEASQLKQSNKILRSDVLGDGQVMLGDSAAMMAVHSMIGRAAPTDANVLILGENGTGKELAAREIHRQSLRSDKVFMSVDLGAVAESLFESELFGHRKGAFTGAQEDRIGRLEAAQGGTLFLDEIGNIPLSLQAKLLTVLAQREVTPLGSNRSIPIDVRIVAATNMPRDALADGKQFRQDLLFRLNTVEIKLPALRDRAEDIEGLANYYGAYYARKYRKPERSLSKEAMLAAQADLWPGNVRALRHCLERAVILAEGEQLELRDLQLLSSTSLGEESSPVAESQARPALDVSEDLNLERMEQRMIEQALKTHRYNISHAAKDLGLTRAALYRRMEKYGL